MTDLSNAFSFWKKSTNTYQALSSVSDDDSYKKMLPIIGEFILSTYLGISNAYSIALHNSTGKSLMYKDRVLDTFSKTEIKGEIRLVRDGSNVTISDDEVSFTQSSESDNYVELLYQAAIAYDIFIPKNIVSYLKDLGYNDRFVKIQQDLLQTNLSEESYIFGPLPETITSIIVNRILMTNVSHFIIINTSYDSYRLLKQIGKLENSFFLPPYKSYFERADGSIYPVTTIYSCIFINSPTKVRDLPLLKEMWKTINWLPEEDILPLEIEEKDDDTYLIHNKMGGYDLLIPYLVSLCLNRGIPIFCGEKNDYLQVVLAISAYIAGVKAILFIQSNNSIHSHINLKAKSFCSELYLLKGSLEDLDEIARNHKVEKPHFFLSSFILGMKDVFREKLKQRVAKTEFFIRNPVKRMWVSTKGRESLDLIRILGEIFPYAEIIPQKDKEQQQDLKQGYIYT